jgi:hypothetical protein
LNIYVTKMYGIMNSIHLIGDKLSWSEGKRVVYLIATPRILQLQYVSLFLQATKSLRESRVIAPLCF